jgi:hypothetical protein
MGYRDGVGAQRKFVGPMEYAFRRIIGVAEGICPTMFPSRLGMDPASAFGIMCGAE